MLDVRPVPMTQVAIARGGRRYEISAAAGSVVADLVALDSSLSVWYEEAGEFFAIVQTIPGGPRKGTEDVVDRVPAVDWDGRVVAKWAMRTHELRNGLNGADRLDAEEAVADRQRDYELEQAVGERAYDLMRAIQKETLGINPRAFISRPKSLPLAA